MVLIWDLLNDKHIIRHIKWIRENIGSALKSNISGLLFFMAEILIGNVNEVVKRCLNFLGFRGQKRVMFCAIKDTSSGVIKSFRGDTSSETTGDTSCVCA